MRKLRTVYRLVVAAAGLLTASCQHKELCYDHSHVVDFQVVFDWRKAPQANPASMLMYLFPEEGGKVNRFEFMSPAGGSLRMNAGRYSGIGLNGGNADWVRFRGADRYETFEVYSSTAAVLPGSGISVETLPKADGALDERIAVAPGEVWCDNVEHYELHVQNAASQIQTLTMYPEEAVCHYSVEFINVRNLQYLEGTTLDATLSGLAEGCFPAAGTATDRPVTFPFAGEISQSENRVEGRFLTFGDCQTVETRHYLRVYMVLTDQTKWYATYDVTDQIHHAEDPTNVHVVVDGLVLPEPISGGGLVPDVDEWQPVTEVVIPM